MAISIRAFDHWTIAVSDLDRASDFYTDVMGWHPVDAAAETADEAWGPLPGRESGAAQTRRFVRDGQRVEMVSVPSETWRSAAAPQVNHLGLSHMTVATGPTDRVLEALRRRGGRVREHTRSSFIPGVESPGNQFLFEDPDGNVIETFEAGDDWNPFDGVGESETAGGSPFGIDHLSHWSLCVADPARSLRFYRDVLGWRELSALDWEGPGPSHVMDVGPARLTTWLLGASTQRIEIIHFSQPAVVAREGSGVSTTGLSHLTVVVDNDVAAAVSELEAAGAEPVVTKGAAGEAVVFQDPDGNLIRGVPVPPTWSRAD